jgi:hypothetical protein
VGRAQVRTAVAEALSGSSVPFLGTVYPARPLLTNDDDYYAGMMAAVNPDGSGCIAVVNLPGPDKRVRRADVGRGAVNDTVVHAVVLELFFASTGGDPLSAQQDYDALVDGLFILIRNNPLLSAPETIWSAGEYAAGVQHDQSQPLTSEDGLTVLITGTVRFEAWEWVAGTGV